MSFSSRRTFAPSLNDGIRNLVATYWFSHACFVTFATVRLRAENIHINPRSRSTSQLGAPKMGTYPFSAHFEPSSSIVCAISLLKRFPRRVMLSTKHNHSNSLPTFPFVIYKRGNDAPRFVSTPKHTLFTWLSGWEDANSKPATGFGSALLKS